jgi:hypothetical protein
MKKILFAAAVITSLNADPLSGALDNILDDLFGELNKAGQGVPGTCYAPQNVQDANVCSSLPALTNLEENLCKDLPDIPGFKKKSSTTALNANSAVIQYCNTATRETAGAIGNVDIYAGDLGEEVKYPNGKTIQQIQNAINVKKILGAAESAANKAFLSGDQTTLRTLVKLMKLTNSQDISKIKPEDVKAPNDLKDYNLQTKALASLTNSDVIMSNPVSVSNGINEKISGKKGDAARTVAAQEAMKLNDAIDAGTTKRVGLIMEATARPDDIAIPTQDTINLLRPDLKIATVAKIQQQMARQALIMAEIQQIDDARKNIVSITAQKAAIMNEQFNKDAAENYINGLIQ